MLDDAADLARRALAEDGARDVTTLVTTSSPLEAQGVIEVRTDTVLAGTRYADAVLAACGLPPVAWRFHEGDRMLAGTVAGTLGGSLRGVLLAERTFLNFLQRACGIATMTRRYVDAVAHTGARILHTRKTAPGLRQFDVAAVCAGGGGVHRVDLARTVMVKDNHWRALAQGGRTLADALQQARELGVLDAVRGGRITGAGRRGMRCRRHPAPRRQPVAGYGGGLGCTTPAAGGRASRSRRREELRWRTWGYAQAAADFISIGALTHSVIAADISLELRQG